MNTVPRNFSCMGCEALKEGASTGSCTDCLNRKRFTPEAHDTQAMVQLRTPPKQADTRGTTA